MLRPRPKTRSLQRGSVPVVEKTQCDPLASSDFGNYHRANVAGYNGAVPSEIYEYTLVYAAFRADVEFWKHWHVVNCARNDPNMSISHINACIRVVMDLPSSQKLYPSVYTPCFSILPCIAARTGTEEQTPKKVAGLPPGYSVALDVHILEDSRPILDIMRREGRIAWKYRWLDAIVAKADLCQIFGLPLRSNDKAQRGEGHMITIDDFEGRLKSVECRARGQSLFPDRRSKQEAHKLIKQYARAHVAQTESTTATEEDGAPLPDFIDGLLRQHSMNWASEEDARVDISEAKQKAATQQTIAQLRPCKTLQTIAINFPNSFDNVLTNGEEERSSHLIDIEGEDNSHRQYRSKVESFSELYLENGEKAHLKDHFKDVRQVYEECILVSAFDHSALLPPRSHEIGIWKRDL